MCFEFKTTGKRLSNLGRWGADDEQGTLNFLTPSVIFDAVKRIRSGRRYELSIPICSDGPQTGSGNRQNPIHLMNIMPPDFQTADGVDIADDYITMPLQAATHWDGLAHVGYDHHIYNGVSTDTIKVLGGAQRNAIDKTLPGFAGRAVLLDVARYHGKDWLPVEHAIGPQELDDIAKAQGVTFRSGDALLFRTGWRKKALVEGWKNWLKEEPGLTPECAEWMHEREIATVASDNWGIEIQPATDGFLPLHCILIRDMGMMLGENWNLEELSEDCAEDGQWDFFLVAPALRVKGGTGSPVSPVAIK